MGIEVTEKARNNILAIKARVSPDSKYLKIGLRSGGCSGFSYFHEFVDEANETDKIFSFDGLELCMDQKSYFFLNGTVIDYTEDLFKSGLQFNTPKATRACGCGESVSFELPIKGKGM